MEAAPAVKAFTQLPWPVKRFFNRFAIDCACSLTGCYIGPAHADIWGVLPLGEDAEPYPIDVEFFEYQLGLTFESVSESRAVLVAVPEASEVPRRARPSPRSGPASQEELEDMTAIADRLLRLHLCRSTEENTPQAWSDAASVLAWLQDYGVGTPTRGERPEAPAREACTAALLACPEGRTFMAQAGVDPRPWLMALYPTWAAWSKERALVASLPAASPSTPRRVRV